MNYKDYQNSRNASWKLLLDLLLQVLPIKITDVCRQLGVEVRSFEQAAPVQYQRNQRSWSRIDGRVLLLEGKPLILYNDDDPYPRCRFTVAHELGHLVLGHIDAAYGRCIDTQGLYRRMDQPASPQEEQANVFASRLLAPACVLWGLNITTAEQIESVCGISKAAAEYRAKRMQLLYGRDAEFKAKRGYGTFLSHPLERQVYDQFASFIKLNRI